ncbi:MAG: CD1247 N-terminal domain-containing protein [Ethanoligenens sp.]|uniref:CD1247 N-terminal domain-containing protein n=1 Tax=Ethanoligenens sp. TaxID=2099655 RepID=UPI0039E83B47
MTVTEKVAYLKGLVEGLGVDETSKEGRIIKAIVEVLDDVALTVSEVEDSVSEVAEQVDAIDEDLEDLEKDFYGDEDDDDDDEDDDSDYYELTCPKCGEKVYLDDDLLSDGEMTCPKCGEKLEFDFGTDDDDVGYEESANQDDEPEK